MPPTRFSPEALTGITGSARGAGPWTRHAPTYCAPLLSFVFTTSTMGSYWEPWQMQYTGSTPKTLYVGTIAPPGYETYWFSRLTRMMRHGKPVPGTHWLFWYRPRQTPVAPFQSRSKSETLTAVPAFVFHHRSAVGSVV